MLAALAPKEAVGRAYGLERAGDNMGAVAGPLLAAGLVGWLGVRPTLYFAAVPGIIAAITITFAARQARKRVTGLRQRVRLQLADLRQAGLLRPLVPIAAFELGNMATTLLILRGTDLLHTGTRSIAAATSLAVLIYAGHNLAASFVAYGAGHWIDRAGPRLAFAGGAAAYVVSYLLFSLISAGWPLLVLASCWLVSASGWLRPRTPRSSRGCCRITCEAAALACWAAFSHSGLWPLPRLSNCYGLCSLQPLGFSMPRGGC
jgi:MFS family permease